MTPIAPLKCIDVNLNHPRDCINHDLFQTLNPPLALTTLRKSWKKKTWTFHCNYFSMGIGVFIWLICTVVETKIEAWVFDNNFMLWFDWFHVSNCVEAWIFLATISSFDLIDFMFLIVLKLEIFWQQFQALIWLISCF